MRSTLRAASVALTPRQVSRSRLRRSPAKFKHSVTRWPYGKFTVEQLSQMARELGLESVELLEPDEWAIPKRYGLTCAMGYATVPRSSHPAHTGLQSRRQSRLAHSRLSARDTSRCRGGRSKRDLLFRATVAESPTTRDARPVREDSLRSFPLAEQHGVTLCMELLNSKVDHHDYSAITPPGASNS